MLPFLSSQPLPPSLEASAMSIGQKPSLAQAHVQLLYLGATVSSKPWGTVSEVAVLQGCGLPLCIWLCCPPEL